MSIGYCEKHDLRWDMDKTDDCLECENEPAASHPAMGIRERALKAIEHMRQHEQWCGMTPRGADIMQFAIEDAFSGVAESAGIPAGMKLSPYGIDLVSVCRRIAERGLRLAQSDGPRFIDLFQHLLDELQRIEQQVAAPSQGAAGPAIPEEWDGKERRRPVSMMELLARNPPDLTPQDNSDVPDFMAAAPSSEAQSAREPNHLLNGQPIPCWLGCGCKAAPSEAEGILRELDALAEEMHTAARPYFSNNDPDTSDRMHDWADKVEALVSRVRADNTGKAGESQ